MRVNVTGGWVELREPEEVPERLRRPIVSITMAGIPLQAKLDALIENPEQAEAGDLQTFMQFSTEFGDKAALAFIKEWSFPDPITSESIQDLPSKVFDEIQAAISPLANRLLPNFGVDPDPKATTEN